MLSLNLAVAIGGNSLGGGKFKLSGSILGAYIIQALTITLYAMKVSSTADIKYWMNTLDIGFKHTETNRPFNYQCSHISLFEEEKNVCL